MTGNELSLYSDSKFTFRSLTLWINEVIETYCVGVCVVKCEEEGGATPTTEIPSPSIPLPLFWGDINSDLEGLTR